MSAVTIHAAAFHTAVRTDGHGHVVAMSAVTIRAAAAFVQHWMKVLDAKGRNVGSDHSRCGCGDCPAKRATWCASQCRQ